MYIVSLSLYIYMYVCMYVCILKMKDRACMRDSYLHASHVVPWSDAFAQAHQDPKRLDERGDRQLTLALSLCEYMNLYA